MSFFYNCRYNKKDRGRDTKCIGYLCNMTRCAIEARLLSCELKNIEYHIKISLWPGQSPVDDKTFYNIDARSIQYRSACTPCNDSSYKPHYSTRADRHTDTCTYSQTCLKQPPFEEAKLVSIENRWGKPCGIWYRINYPAERIPNTSCLTCHLF